MKHLFVILFALLATESSLRAQDSTAVRQDSAQTATDADALLASLSDSAEAQPLLPHKMIFTQRALWGKKGLLRTMNVAPLTPEGRTKELKIRRGMLTAHQIGGFITLASFVAQGILGAKLYNAFGEDYTRLKRLHEGTATFINVSYGTTLALSLTTPPPIVGAKRGFTTIKLHRYLAVVHLTGMIATNVLANMIQTNHELKPYHRIAAYTTFGAYAASIVALTF
ncbi:hypothetical protein [Spirosoma pomorum]